MRFMVAGGVAAVALFFLGTAGAHAGPIGGPVTKTEPPTTTVAERVVTQRVHIRAGVAIATTPLAVLLCNGHTLMFGGGVVSTPSALVRSTSIRTRRISS